MPPCRHGPARDMGCLCLSEPAPLCPSPHDNPGQAPERRIPALGPGVVGMFFVDHPLGSSLSPPERPRVGKGRWCIPAVPCGLAERAGAGGGVPRGGGPWSRSRTGRSGGLGWAQHSWEALSGPQVTLGTGRGPWDVASCPHPSAFLGTQKPRVLQLTVREQPV